MIRKIIDKLLGKSGAPSGKSAIPQGRRVEIQASEHGIDPALLDDRAVKVVGTLQQAGYEAYIVGGAVRDLLVGRRPKDFDVATNATPEQVKSLFRRAFIIGRRFRIVHVVFGRGREHEVIEVSTFRAYMDASAAEQVAGNEKTSKGEMAGKSHVVDASGRDTFLSNQLGGKRRSQQHSSAAIFGHFEGVGRLPGKDEGNITAGWLNDGWCWLIPFKDGTTSVGVVCHPDYIKSRTVPLDQFLLDTLRQSPPIAKRMERAKPLTQTYAAANFSYRRDTMSGDGYLMVGDAFAFIDPVFSSGVHLALNSGMRGAKVVDAYLRKSPDYAAQLQEFEHMVRRGIKTFSWFIHRFNQPAFEQLFVSTNRPPKMERAVLSLLAGDVFAQSQARLPLFLFKVVYYIVFVLNWKENWAVARRRKQGTRTTVTEVKDYAVNQANAQS